MLLLCPLIASKRVNGLVKGYIEVDTSAPFDSPESSNRCHSHLGRGFREFHLSIGSSPFDGRILCSAFPAKKRRAGRSITKNRKPQQERCHWTASVKTLSCMSLGFFGMRHSIGMHPPHYGAGERSSLAGYLWDDKLYTQQDSPPRRAACCIGMLYWPSSMLMERMRNLNCPALLLHRKIIKIFFAAIICSRAPRDAKRSQHHEIGVDAMHDCERLSRGWTYQEMALSSWLLILAGR